LNEINEGRKASTTSPLTVVTSGHEPVMGLADHSPALFSTYRDLQKLRYDYPLLLIKESTEGKYICSLSNVIDDILQRIAPRGVEGERLRKHGLALEEEIRALVSQGTKGSLIQLWEKAETALLSKAKIAERKALDESFSEARAAVRYGGEVIDCHNETPKKILSHIWAGVQEAKTRKTVNEIEAFALKLSDILKSDSMKSEQAQGADVLKRSVGTVFEKSFDFEAFSDVITSAHTDGVMPEKRRRRIRSVLTVLKSQKFVGTRESTVRPGARGGPFEFSFNGCARALVAFQERLPDMAELVKAMAIAELEIENKYNEADHDPYFKQPDEAFLEPEDLEMFPSYLVCINKGLDRPKELAAVISALTSGLPFKILVQNQDILEDQAIESGQLTFGAAGSQLAMMAMGLKSAFVLQSVVSGLYPLQQSILAGMTVSGPSLYCVYAGQSTKGSKNTACVLPYLQAAAAAESRAFPAFIYNPTAGNDLASRISLAGNPQPTDEWPTHGLNYADPELQSLSEKIAFTFADFVVSDARYAKHFTIVSHSDWQDGMVPLNVFLELDIQALSGKVPYIWVTDKNDLLRRAIVDDELIGATRRCLETWKNLQETGGINNSHACGLLAREKEIWEREKAEELSALKSQPVSETPSASQAVETEAVSASEVEQPEAVDTSVAMTTEGPYIETPRCTTCNECTDLNNRMFAYDDNEQAYITDPDAGTYRQLVTAAESCQVAIIHPGKPRNADEQGLDELVARAEPFN
jgi:hypothetical protein